ncbi:hypothetical protein PROFUN_01806 [Planoprotostelium fungivorum]|uniref:protein-tyrosine-phosphatase n=1 Tax=Planoprotostelium fungivorum TaxID=1890364 RepID=A0A2P6NYQ1_9EUKA|nr:hypothetical protein PROFUN_01806 [Planoprotostelium fungivorum]
MAHPTQLGAVITATNDPDASVSVSKKSKKSNTDLDGTYWTLSTHDDSRSNRRMGREKPTETPSETPSETPLSARRRTPSLPDVAPTEDTSKVSEVKKEEKETEKQKEIETHTDVTIASQPTPVTTPTKHETKKRKRQKEVYDEDEEDVHIDTSEWSEAQRKAYEGRESNPNQYYYRFNRPGEKTRSGLWTSDEQKIFFKRVAEFGPQNWGLFSKVIPGRVGYQCCAFYKNAVASKILEANMPVPPHLYDEETELPPLTGPPKKKTKKGDKKSKTSPEKKKKKQEAGEKKKKEKEVKKEEKEAKKEVKKEKKEEKKEKKEEKKEKKEEKKEKKEEKEVKKEKKKEKKGEKKDKETKRKREEKKTEKEEKKEKTTGNKENDSAVPNVETIPPTDPPSTTSQSTTPNDKKRNLMKPPTAKVSRKDPKQMTLDFFRTGVKMTKKLKEKAEKKQQARDERERVKRVEKEWKEKRREELKVLEENDRKGVLIVDGLYLGNRICAENKQWLEENNIGYIVNATTEIKNTFEKEYKYLRISIQDSSDVDILTHVGRVCDFIEEGMGEKKNTLVHCQLGRSRSVSFVLSFLMTRRGFSLGEALGKVTHAKEDIQINDGFKKQLMELDKKLYGNHSYNFIGSSSRSLRLSQRMIDEKSESLASNNSSLLNSVASLSSLDLDMVQSIDLSILKSDSKDISMGDISLDLLDMEVPQIQITLDPTVMSELEDLPLFGSAPVEPMEVTLNDDWLRAV